MKEIIVECEPDKKLIETIVEVEKLKTRVDIDIIHAGDKPRVLKRTLKIAGSVGVIDEDLWSAQPSALKKFKEMSEDNDLMIRIYKGPNGSTLVELRPRLEEWLLRLCKLFGINPNEYSCPPDLFKKIVNQKLDNLGKLLDELHRKSQHLKRFHQLMVDLISQVSPSE
ncbi:MAG: hypothetical protein ACTSX9_01020 [Candidatus Njordarchaeales archaeon]